jgi:hypothetical protein
VNLNSSFETPTCFHRSKPNIYLIIQRNYSSRDTQSLLARSVTRAPTVVSVSRGGGCCSATPTPSTRAAAHTPARAAPPPLSIRNTSANTSLSCTRPKEKKRDGPCRPMSWQGPVPPVLYRSRAGQAWKSINAAGGRKRRRWAGRLFSACRIVRWH